MAWSIFTDGGGPLVAKGWAEQLLKLIGAPTSPGNMQFVYDWEVSEGGGGKFNPLNQGPVPGHPSWTTTGSQYGGGAADFTSWLTGLWGAAAYLSMPNFVAIRNNLRANNPVAARNALIASPWAASHYNGGAGFSNAPLPGGTAVLPPVGASATVGGGTAGNCDTSCLICVPLPSVGAFGLSVGGGGICLFHKSEARAVIGGLALAGGAAMFVVGTVVLAAFGLRTTGAARGVGSAIEATGGAVALLPGAEAAGAGIAVAGSRVKKAGEAGAAQRASQRARRAEAGRAEAGRAPGNPKASRAEA